MLNLKTNIIAALLGTLLGAFIYAKVAPKPEAVDYDRVARIVAYEVKKVPPPTVSVQPFDVDKIKHLKVFNYAPQFTGSISVAGVDSAALQVMIDRAVENSLEKYTVKRKR